LLSETARDTLNRATQHGSRLRQPAPLCHGDIQDYPWWSKWLARRARSTSTSRRRKPADQWRFIRCFLLLACVVTAALLAWRGTELLRLGKSRTPLHLTMDEARAINADIPFVDSPVRPAAPYAFRGSATYAREAVDCLATAAIYESARSADGQRAVIQVILNRVRSYGFPKTICGVVYQGAGKETGCQFSFACDQSLSRRHEPRGWSAARRRAAHALHGYVFPQVGTATHYHTDWIVPYWSASLDKIAKVDSHIFYRRHH
jgi:spore germination cell wall hydrolase CwlJ-like protein